jgi:hypothetical protein
LIISILAQQCTGFARGFDCQRAWTSEARKKNGERRSPPGETKTLYNRVAEAASTRECRFCGWCVLARRSPRHFTVLIVRTIRHCDAMQRREMVFIYRVPVAASSIMMSWRRSPRPSALLATLAPAETEPGGSSCSLIGLQQRPA